MLYVIAKIIRPDNFSLYLKPYILLIDFYTES